MTNNKIRFKTEKHHNESINSLIDLTLLFTSFRYNIQQDDRNDTYRFLREKTLATTASHRVPELPGYTRMGTRANKQHSIGENETWFGGDNSLAWY
uniref:Uncharacterized protein n=1 Tax=Romanomermis culicivorax TaxID=13658 RepID=A0A915IEM6_ROMCU